MNDSPALAQRKFLHGRRVQFVVSDEASEAVVRAWLVLGIMRLV